MFGSERLACQGALWTFWTKQLIAIYQQFSENNKVNKFRINVVEYCLQYHCIDRGPVSCDPFAMHFCNKSHIY